MRALFAVIVLIYLLQAAAPQGVRLRFEMPLEHVFAGEPLPARVTVEPLVLVRQAVGASFVADEVL